MQDSTTPLVVGAGPVGLTMACELARHGVRPRIIDQAPEPSQTSKALGIFPRTLEVFEMMGIADRFLDLGQRLRGLVIHHGPSKVAEIDLTSVSTPYPFALSLPQSETERLLLEHLSTYQITVERGVSLTGLSQLSNEVRAFLKHADGHEEIYETQWLIGCDGAHSATRHALGLEFEGAPYDESFVLADVRAESDLTRDHVHLFLGDKGIFGLIPLGSERWRVVANIPPESRSQNLPDPTLEEIQELCDHRGPAGLTLGDPAWLSRFHISHRIVREFRKLRVFLAGDAAHIHSPAGGQGMNTGIQDAFNLAWKLALVCRGRAPARLLASYHIEREPIARGVLNLTDRITRMATIHSSWAKGLRDVLFPIVGGIDLVKDQIAGRLTEVSLNYCQSSIVESHGTTGPRAGERVLDGELRDDHGQARRLYELLCGPRHVLLIFLGANENPPAEIERLREVMAAFPPDLIETHRIARGKGSALSELHDVSGLVHQTYRLLAGGLILIRPDGYIAYRDDKIHPEKLGRYLANIFLTQPAQAG